jgi:hypothetical protein
LPNALSYDEEALLFAINIATTKLGKRCLNPQEIFQFILPETRVGNLEPEGALESAVKVLEGLVSKRYLKHCTPIVGPIIGYQGYKVARKGREYARGLLRRKLRRPGRQRARLD